jgi:hypothetical protein
MFLIPLALVTDTLLRLDAAAYLIGVALFARLVQSMPYWRYRDRLLSFANQSHTEIGLAANASQSRC